MIRTIVTIPLTWVVQQQSLFIKNFGISVPAVTIRHLNETPAQEDPSPKFDSLTHPATSACAWSGFKRYDRETDSVRQITQTVEDFQTSNTTILPVGTSSFPTLETHSQVFDGVKYSDLPIIHVKSTSNNTIIVATSSDGKVVAVQSGGRVGFRNARKGTNVAAQAVAIALAAEAIRNHMVTVRVCLRGIGAGRLPALKALELSGLKIVSITDTTPLAHNGNRPKKVRRL